MKLHRITVENLNSLYGSHTVDFDGSLEGASLFLIHGPTGSGKSTLMDAVSLALFATTPRMRDLRSDRDIAEQIMSRGTGRCSAELEFSKLEPGSGTRRRYRAKWTARRARERADGTIRPTDRSLERLDGGQWRTLVSDHREKEVGPHFESVLEGFTPEDFQRSMLLAQGEFDALLNATREERASILERLTSTERYREIGARAARMHRAWSRRLERLEAAVDAVGAVDRSVLEAARAGAKEAKAALDEAASRVGALERVEGWRRDLARKREELGQAEERHARARAAWDALADDRDALEAFEKARPALDRLAALDRLRKAREAAATELAARRERLPGLAEAFAAATAAQEQAQRDYDRAKAVRDRLLEPLVRVREADTALRQARSALGKAEVQVAACAREVEEGEATVAAAEREADEARRTLERAVLEGPGADDAMRGRLQVHLAPDIDLPGARTALDAEADRCRTERQSAARAQEARVALDGVRGELTRARTEAGARSATLAELRDELAGAETARAAAEAADTEARAAFETLQRRRGFAEHRAALEAGEPCPLCGSEEHPWAGDGAPDHDTAFTAAQAHRDGVAAALADARSRCDRLRGRLDQLEAAAKEAERRTEEWVRRESAAADAWVESCREAGLDPALEADALRRRVEAADEGLEWLRGCETALSRVESRRQLLEARRAALEGARTRRDQATAGRDREREAVGGAQAALDEARLALATIWTEAAGPAGAGGPEAPDDRPGADAEPVAIERYQHARVEALDRARDDARGGLDQARARKESCEREIARLETVEAEAAGETEAARTALRAAMDELDVTSEEALRERRLPDERAQAIRQAVESEAARVQQAAGAVQTRSEDLAGHESAKPDHPAVDASAEELAAALEGARAGEAEAREAADTRNAELLSLEQAAARAREAAERLASARDRARVWQRLHKLIGIREGEQFKEFAQALNLRRLLHQANQQLTRLKDRYELKQVWSGSRDADDDGEEKPRFPTLEFEVEDRFRPGTPRSIKTLSGGESFLVSLALALGLSDLRTSSMPVETLLLDEGFGTLDPETLDTALAALQQLQATGRQIGIISHVVGLKERIEARIEVRAVGEGRSEIRVGVEGGR